MDDHQRPKQRTNQRPNPHPNQRRWLSKDLSALIQQQSAKQEIYDLVIVGSGYGGAMAAAQLAGLVDAKGNPLKICLLERGKEYLPGSFPSQMGEVPGHIRVVTPNAKKPQGFADGLFDIRPGADVSTLTANGLGGGSLINAGVMAEPKWHTFDSGLPPQLIQELIASYPTIRNKLGCTVEEWDVAKQEMIERKIVADPANALPRSQALQALDPHNFGNSPQPTFRQAALTIKMSQEPEANLQPCKQCGDCMTGCNIGAKKSLDTNLLLGARNKGVEIYTGASVLKLERVKSSQTWKLHIFHTDENLRQRQGAAFRLRARKVILAAGTLGSPEILLRSQSKNLHFSKRLGQQFSCNGDNIATFYKLATRVETIADENLALDARKIGPTIACMLDIPKTANRQGFLLQEFAIPGAMATLFKEVVTTANTLYDLPEPDCSYHQRAAQGSPTLDPCAVDPDAMAYTALLGIIGHDSANGVLRLDPESPAARPKPGYSGMIRISWPDARNGTQLNAAMDYVHQLGQQDKTLLQPGGRLIPNPMWQLGPEGLATLIDQPRGPVLTVHPLGGCPIGKDSDHGVVDDYGMVFDPAAQPGARSETDATWQGTLFVLDGSIIPCSLGANPALTIATLAHRAALQLRRQWAWQAASTPPTPAIKPVAKRPVFRAPAACITPAKATRLLMAERLFGKVLLHSNDGILRDYWVELTLRYDEIAIQELMTTLDRRVILKKGSRLCIFNPKDWENLQLLSDPERENQREQKALLRAELTGSLEIFNRENNFSLTRMRTGLWAWFCNRGLRDTTQMFNNQFRDAGSKWDALRALPAKATKLARNIKNLASHAGEVRRMDYKLTIGHCVSRADADIFTGKHSPQGKHIEGEKRLTYNRRANPLRQLMELQLTRFPSIQLGPTAKLELDLRFVALQEMPLAQIIEQKNQINALMDLASFGLYLLRLMLLTHMWTFRKPDPTPDRKIDRLPQKLSDALQPEISEIDVCPPRHGIPVRVRLSRYRLPDMNPAHKPLVMIHGYSASGSTFAHPAIGTSMAQYFAELGRDIWILDLRTSAGMPSAVLPWRFEDAAFEDIPLAIAHILRVTGQDQVDIFAHCIGAVMISMAILTDPDKIEEVFPSDLVQRQDQRPRRFYRTQLALLQNSIRRLVLSQKGPVLKYTQGNMLRAWLMRSLRKVALPDNFQFTTPKNASLRDQIIDRWLNVLSCKAEEFDRENPFLWYNPFQWGKPTPWVGFRHRMDALYARDFNVNNIADSTLAYIEDLFGPLNLETVSQAIHFVRYDKITDTYGRNMFVSRANLLARWSKLDDTMSIHGAENGLADPATLALMKNLMRDANIPFKARPAFENMGHQDMLIGKHNTDVFKEVEAFLSAPKASTVPATAPQEWHGYLPWLGPRLEAQYEANNRIAVMPDPKLGSGQVLCIPVARQIKQADEVEYTLAADFVGELASVTAKARVWSTVTIPASTLDLAQAEGVLVIMLYDEAVVDGMVAKKETATPIREPSVPPPVSKMYPKEKLIEILDHVQNPKRFDARSIAQAFISKAEIVCRIGVGYSSDLCFAFGSCQYTVGLMDRPKAEYAIKQLAQRLPEPDANASDDNTVLRPELLLLLGDQIYSDATAGLLDPSRADARYLHPHEDWLRMEPLRRVMRKIPVYCMLDDHEIIDNWRPRPGRPVSWHLTQGRKYYRIFQPVASNPTFVGTHEDDLWYAFEHKGLPFFMADSRSQRSPRTALTLDPAKTKGKDPEILGVDQMQQLKNWLASCDPNLPKFISTAAMLLPRHVADESDTLHMDGWDGFPAALHELLAFIADQEIRNVIFLSGDEHVSSITQITLQNLACNKTTHILSLHSSGFYAPFPFANALPEDIPTKDQFSFSKGGATWQCSTSTTIINQGDGYMLVKLSQNQQNQWQLDLEFDGQNGTWRWPQTPWILR